MKLLLVVASVCIGASVAYADFVPELPGTETVPADARSAGMGGVGIASSEEAGCLLLNPAALALVRRGELTASILYQRRDVGSGYFGQDRSRQINSAELSAAGFVYPVAVYRGALAFGFSYHRSSLFDRDLFRKGDQPGPLEPGEPDHYEDEKLEEHGSMDRWTIGAAVQISPSAFIGAGISLLSGAMTRRSEFEYAFENLSPPHEDYYYLFESEENLDLGGFRGSIGGLFFPSDQLRVGFRIDLPYTVSYEGQGEEVFYASAVSDLVGPARDEDEAIYRIDDEVSYPLAAGFGVASRFNKLLLAIDAEFIPYTLLELNGERLRTQADLAEGYRDVMRAGVGLEYTFPVPVRLRVGYRFAPDAFRLIVGEVRDQDIVVGDFDDDPNLDVRLNGFMEEADFGPERHVLTAGLGWLVDMTLNVDLAVEYSRSEKNGKNVDQDDAITRFYLTTAYRF